MAHHFCFARRGGSLYKGIVFNADVCLACAATKAKMISVNRAFDRVLVCGVCVIFFLKLVK